MYELIQVSDRAYYVQCPAKIGIVKMNDTAVCLIDSGNDKDAAKKVRKILDANGWRLQAIFNTHSHADHIGGNKHLQDQTGCAVYAPAIEDAFTRHPVLEPSLLYGGCPPKTLRGKFLMAQESRADVLSEAVLPDGWEIVPLPGHALNMVGFRTPDNVVYLADCLSGKDTLDKYGIGYIYDVGAYLETLESVKAMQAAAFIPSHAPVTDDIAPLAQYNIDKVNAVAAAILSHCETPITFEDLLAHLFEDYALTMTAEQYVLVGGTVKSYLSWLCDSGKLTVRFEDCHRLFETAK